MNDTEQIIDQSKLAEDVSSKIHLEMRQHFLVKPLEPVKVLKEFDKPVAKDNAPKADDNGIEAIDYEEVKTETKEVDSDFKRGVVLKIPHEYNQYKKDWEPLPINIGDIVIYPVRAAKWFDHIKDAELINQYDIIAVER